MRLTGTVFDVLTKINLKNFKSLADFTLPLSKFNCLVGLNGSGKSTVLQAFDFLSRLMAGDIDKWLDSRGWDVEDLKFRLPEKQEKTIAFTVHYAQSAQLTMRWKGQFSQHSKRCKTEDIEAWETGTTDGDRSYTKRSFLNVGNGYYTLSTDDFDDRKGGFEPKKIAFDYQGSILSQLSDDYIETLPELLDFKRYVKNIRSLDLLSPHLLKSNSRDNEDIGLGGERFPSFLKTLSDKNHRELLEQFRIFYPQMEDFLIRTQRGGVKKLVVREDCGESGHIDFGAPHVNDGTLRLLAILAQLHTDRSVLLFDEIENGINSELFGRLAKILIESDKQVVVTTHSPMILNYLSEEVAKESVTLLFKKHGATYATPFFSLPEVIDKLDFFGPGEAYVNTNLEELVVHLQEQDS